MDEALVVPSSETGRIQEMHLAIEHAVCELVEADLGSGEKQRGKGLRTEEYRVPSDQS